MADGNGRGSSGRVNTSGIAPNSKIVVVKVAATRKGTRDEVAEVPIVHGIEFVDSYAHVCNLPYVVNLSLGPLAGPRDGSSLYERTLFSTLLKKSG